MTSSPTNTTRQNADFLKEHLIFNKLRPTSKTEYLSPLLSIRICQGALPDSRGHFHRIRKDDTRRSSATPLGDGCDARMLIL